MAIGNDGHISELGVINCGNVVWRIPTRTLIALYRAGVRFRIWCEGRHAEVLVDQLDPREEPRLRTVADRIGDKKLFRLPALPC